MTKELFQGSSAGGAAFTLAPGSVGIGGNGSPGSEDKEGGPSADPLGGFGTVAVAEPSEAAASAVTCESAAGARPELAEPLSVGATIPGEGLCGGEGALPTVLGLFDGAAMGSSTDNEEASPLGTSAAVVRHCCTYSISWSSNLSDGAVDMGTPPSLAIALHGGAGPVTTRRLMIPHVSSAGTPLPYFF